MIPLSQEAVLQGISPEGSSSLKHAPHGIRKSTCHRGLGKHLNRQKGNEQRKRSKEWLLK